MMTTRTRQKLTYAVLLALSAATALVLYPIINKPLVLLHHADVLWREGRTAEADALVVQAVYEGARRPDSVLRVAGMLLDDGRIAEIFSAARHLCETYGNTRIIRSPRRSGN